MDYENKELLKGAVKTSLESLKDLKPGSDEYNVVADKALKLYEMQLKDDAQENEKQLKEDEAVRKEHEIELDEAQKKKARRMDIAKMAMQGVGLLVTVGTTIYWSVCEAGGVMPLSRSMNEGIREIKRGFTERK